MDYKSSSSFPGFSTFYVLEDPANNHSFRGRISLSSSDALAQTRAEKNFDGIKLEWAMGKQEPSDIVRTTTAAPIVVSERVHHLFSAKRFSGWQTYPVEIVEKDDQRYPGYQGLAVTGRCGPVDGTKSVPFEKPMPGGVFTWFRGIYFDPATWDGSDFFMPAGAGWIFVVEDVRNALVASKVKNIVLTPLSEVERMTR